MKNIWLSGSMSLLHWILFLETYTWPELKTGQLLYDLYRVVRFVKKGKKAKLLHPADGTVTYIIAGLYKPVKSCKETFSKIHYSSEYFYMER